MSREVIIVANETSLTKGAAILSERGISGVPASDCDG